MSTELNGNRVRGAWTPAPPLDPYAGLLKVSLETEEARVPVRQRAGDAGMDLFVSETVVIQYGQFRDVQCGIRLQLPEGYWARITGRSSTLRTKGLLVNEAVIDNGYIGSIYVGVRNLNERSVQVTAGERLAQIILHRLEQVPVAVVNPGELASRDGRGTSGFGSTGS